MFSIVYVQRLCRSLDKHEEAYSNSYLSVLVAEGRTDEVNFSICCFTGYSERELLLKIKIEKREKSVKNTTVEVYNIHRRVV